MRITPQQNASVAGFAALLVLFFGWFQTAVGTSTPFYNFTVDAFYWILKIGGFFLLAVAGLCLAGRREGLLLDVFVSGIIGAALVLCGAYWAFAGGSVSVYYLIYMVFGAMFLGAAKTCWVSYGAGHVHDHAVSQPPAPPVAGPNRRPKPVAVAKPVEPAVHPASIRPSSMPADGSAPPGGYLAALAREKDEPPRAAHE